jgi:hypothetical protein
MKFSPVASFEGHQSLFRVSFRGNPQCYLQRAGKGVTKQWIGKCPVLGILSLEKVFCDYIILNPQ